VTEHTYLLALDAGCDANDVLKIQRFITNGGDFSSWWNHLPMIFILESAHSAEAIGEKLHALTPSARFFQTEVNLAESQGWLPRKSWPWIEKRAEAAKREKSIQA
jgi:hypothetical protein